MELKSAGKDQKELREIARALIAKAKEGEGWAIQQVADRLDGKPHQTVDATIEHIDADQLSDEQITRRLAELDARRRRVGKASEETAGTQHSSGKLN